MWGETLPCMASKSSCSGHVAASCLWLVQPAVKRQCPEDDALLRAELLPGNKIPEGEPLEDVATALGPPQDNVPEGDAAEGVRGMRGAELPATGRARGIPGEELPGTEGARGMRGKELPAAEGGRSMRGEDFPARNGIPEPRKTSATQGPRSPAGLPLAAGAPGAVTAFSIPWSTALWPVRVALEEGTPVLTRPCFSQSK